MALTTPAQALAAEAGQVFATGFFGPWGVAYDDFGNLYVADPGGYRIAVYDPSGKATRTFGTPGSCEGCLNYPTGICISGIEVFVCDTNNGRIAIFETGGNWVGAMGGLGIATAKLASPSGVCAGDEWIWVANTRGHVVQRYSWTDRRIDQAFGYLGDDQTALAKGTIDYKLRLPTAVAMGPQGRIYVLDSKHARVLALEKDGSLIWESRPEFGGLGLNRPQAMLCAEDEIYLADTGNDRILKLDYQGQVRDGIRGIVDPHGLALYRQKMAVSQFKTKTVRLIDQF